VQLPRPRFTVRRMLIAVAVAGLVFSLGREELRLHRMRTYHARAIKRMHIMMSLIAEPGKEQIAEFHESMALKCQTATVNPWLPVPVDPPEPK
jgi:hypothetical protein